MQQGPLDNGTASGLYDSHHANRTTGTIGHKVVMTPKDYSLMRHAIPMTMERPIGPMKHRVPMTMELGPLTTGQPLALWDTVSK